MGFSECEDVLLWDLHSHISAKRRHHIYYIVLSLGRFNLYANSYGFLALKARRNFYWKLEVSGLVFFWTWFGALLWGLPNWKIRLAYLMISHIVTSPVHVQVSRWSLAYSNDIGVDRKDSLPADRALPLCAVN